MSKKFKFLGLGLAVLLLVAGVGASSASADLTIAALTVTSSGALTLDGAAASAIVVGSAQTSGTIVIGGSAATGAISLGSSTGAQAINVGVGGTGAKTIIIGDGASTGTTTINSGSGGTLVTSADDNALSVGANGATNPVLQVDASTASVATGVKVTGAAAGSSVTLASISSGTDEKLLINSKGGSEIRLNSRTDSASTTGDFIGAQIKPGVGIAKTSGGVTGVEISPRVNDTFALTTGSVIGAHIDAYLKGTTGNIGGDVRGAQIELVTDDAGARTITGDVTGLRFRSAFSATGITGNFQAIKIEKPETQTNSQTYDSVLTLTSTIPLVWNDAPGTEPTTADGYIKVIVNGNARYIQLYSGAPVD